jgi:Lateral organ boundaries (LOB) domain
MQHFPCICIYFYNCFIIYFALILLFFNKPLKYENRWHGSSHSINILFQSSTLMVWIPEAAGSVDLACTLSPDIDPKWSSSPCGACKFLRRKCIPDCVFAPDFLSKRGGAARFTSVHRVFGASNAAKMLARVPVACRADAVMTICHRRGHG